MKVNTPTWEYFSKGFPELSKRITPEELWDMTVDNYGLEGSILVRKGEAKIDFKLNDVSYTCKRPAWEVIIYIGENIKDEKYDLLLSDALDYIAEHKLLKFK